MSPKTSMADAIGVNAERIGDLMNEFHHLTFSQREGKKPLPEPLRLEYLRNKFRNRVWLYVDHAIEKSSEYSTATGFGPFYKKQSRR